MVFHLNVQDNNDDV